jgi:hypothetical protein
LLEETTKDLRVSRCVPREFEKYNEPDRFQALRALRSAFLELKESDTLSDKVKTELDEAYKLNPMLRRIFYEAQLDHDSALFQLRLALEPVAFKGPRTQVATMMDDGRGSTGKGTLRDLCEECLGVHSGGRQKGYAAVMKQESLIVKKQEGPSEQLSNVMLCRHVWVDDFAPSCPLSTAVLRQLSGGNNITAARKHAKELAFKFTGQLFLACNGLWRGDEAFKGADARRMTGLNFEVHFVDVVRGQNEMRKDSTIKRQINAFFSAFWFFALALHLLPQPRDTSDYTEPKPPNTMALVNMLLRNTDEDDAEADLGEFWVQEFVDAKMEAYVLAEKKPATCNEVDQALCHWLSKQVDARMLLGKIFFRKNGYHLPASGTRKRTTVNVYLKGDVAWTLKSQSSNPL